MKQVYRNILIMVAGFCVLQLLFHGKIFLIIALTVLMLSAISERAAIGIDRFWIWIGEAMGKVTSPIILAVVYYLVLTPIAFLSRIGNKDSLQLKAPKKSNFIIKHHRYSAKDLENPW
jgi:hypothetical protein